jgi:hypothetical protein
VVGVSALVESRCCIVFVIQDTTPFSWETSIRTRRSRLPIYGGRLDVCLNRSAMTCHDASLGSTNSCTDQQLHPCLLCGCRR